MNEAVLLKAINDARTHELRVSGCRSCLRTNARWLRTEFARRNRSA